MSGDQKERMGLTEQEFAIFKQIIQERMSQGTQIEREDFDGYEVPPRTQFSMLRKPAVSIKWGKMTFNMAAIRLFKGIKYILPMVNRKKKRLAIVPCMEEEASSVEWARQKMSDKSWVNKDVTSIDFIEKIFETMGWARECRYKAIGRLASSERGMILVFDLEEAVMFDPNKKETIDPVTGETKKRQVVFYPDYYKDRIGKSYSEYAEYRQMTMFEDITGYIAADEGKPQTVDDSSNPASLDS